MTTIKATWTGYVGFSADGAVHVPGCVEEVDQQVAQANPHFAPTGQTYTPPAPTGVEPEAAEAAA